MLQPNREQGPPTLDLALPSRHAEYSIPMGLRGNVVTDVDHTEQTSIALSATPVANYKGKDIFAEVFENRTHGRILQLNSNNLISSTRDRELIYEMLVHPALAVAKNISKVLVLGNMDGEAVRQVLLHKDVERLVHVVPDGDIVKLCQEHFIDPLDAKHPETMAFWSDARKEQIVADPAEYIPECVERFDVIILNPADVVSQEHVYSQAFLQQCALLLQDGGMFSVATGSPTIGTSDFWRLTYNLHQTFSRVYPMFGSVPLYSKGLTSWSVAMLDDINMTKPNEERLSPLLERFVYYSPEIHTAAMVMPAWIHRVMVQVRRERKREIMKNVEEINTRLKTPASTQAFWNDIRITDALKTIVHTKEGKEKIDYNVLADWMSNQDSYITPKSAFIPLKYNTYTDWFSRKLSPTTLKNSLASANSPGVTICSPAECRLGAVMEFQSGVMALKKGPARVFDVLRELDSDIAAGKRYCVQQLNLWECDYHYIHSPCDGKLLFVKRYPASKLLFGDNQCTLFGFRLASKQNMYLMAIGQDNVQDFAVTITAGSQVKKLDTLGFFQLGSQTLLVFPQDDGVQLETTIMKKLFPGDKMAVQPSELRMPEARPFSGCF